MKIKKLAMIMIASAGMWTAVTHSMGVLLAPLVLPLAAVSAYFQVVNKRHEEFQRQLKNAADKVMQNEINDMVLASRMRCNKSDQREALLTCKETSDRNLVYALIKHDVQFKDVRRDQKDAVSELSSNESLKDLYSNMQSCGLAGELGRRLPKNIIPYAIAMGRYAVEDEDFSRYRQEAIQKEIQKRVSN